jgi:hypothetical protein
MPSALSSRQEHRRRNLKNVLIILSVVVALFVACVFWLIRNRDAARTAQKILGQSPAAAEPAVMPRLGRGHVAGLGCGGPLVLPRIAA